MGTADESSASAWNVAAQAISLAINCVLSLLGNFLVSLTLIKRDQLILPSNRLVFNLTGTNFLFSLLVLPFVIASVAEQRWPFGIFWCNFTAFLTLLFGLASILTLAVIAIDRYYAIVKPMMYATTITTSKSTAMLLWVWIQAAVCSLPPLLGWSKFEYLDGKAACAVAWDSDLGYTVVLLSSCVFLPLSIMSTCYYFIFRVARDKCRKIHAIAATEARADDATVRTGARRLSLPKRPSWAPSPFDPATKGIRTICVVMGAFLATWAPYVASAIAEAACGSHYPSRPFRAFSAWMMYFSTVVHPVVYGLYNRSIRREIRTYLFPPGARAKKGLPRRPSRRLSFSGSLLEYAPSRLLGASGRAPAESGRASIDLGSLASARSADRKGSRDSGAATTTTNGDAEPRLLPGSVARCSFTSSRIPPRTAGSATDFLPIPGAIATPPKEGDSTVDPKSEPGDESTAPPMEEVASRSKSAFSIQTSESGRPRCVDEGIVDDCIVQDIE